MVDPPSADGSGGELREDEGPPGSTHRFVVHVEEDLVDLVPGYLENRRKDVEKVRASVLLRDFDAVRVVGHSMAGSGGGYGFAGITRIGRNIEKGALAKDADAVLLAARELEVYIGRVVVEPA